MTRRMLEISSTKVQRVTMSSQSCFARSTFVRTGHLSFAWAANFKFLCAIEGVRRLDRPLLDK